MIKFGNTFVNVGGTYLKNYVGQDPYNPIGLPPRTVRVKTTDNNPPIIGSNRQSSATVITQVPGLEGIYDVSAVKQTTDIGFYDLFGNSYNLEKVLGVNPGDITDVAMMFQNASALNYVRLFDTSNITRASYMFNGCSSLNYVPDFDTRNVKRIDGMFKNCINLKKAPSLNTSKATHMNNAFENCKQCRIFPTYDCSSCLNLGYMFRYCSYLTHQAVSNTNKVKNFEYAWSNTKVSSFNGLDTTNASSMIAMFEGTDITEIPTLNTNNVENLASIFSNCYNLTSVNNFNLGAGKYLYATFSNCHSLSSIPNYDLTNITGMGNICYGCSSLTSVPNFSNVSNIVWASFAFSGCVNVESGTSALYSKLSSVSELTAYKDAFKYCGVNTEQGLLELQQIPSAWGGLGE